MVRGNRAKMRRATVLTFACLTAALGPARSGGGQVLPLPLQVGAPYATARRNLIAAGWRKQRSPDPSACAGLLADRRCSLFEEIGSCSHTGMGFCRFNWRAADGRGLAVITSGGTPAGDPGVVSSWFLDP